MHRAGRLSAAVLSLALVSAPLAATRPGWPQLRGARQDGVALGAELLDGQIGLELAWKIELGSGFSGIVVAGDRVLTLFAAGDDDVLAAFEAASGRALWRYRIGDTFPAVGGSSEGPLSTPVVSGEAVYGLGPWGRLFAVRLADGTELWTRSFDGGAEASQPRFGFTTVPVVVDDTLVLMTGGPEGHSITGLEPSDGTTRWSHGDGPVQYQSPLVFSLGGRSLVVAVNDRRFVALSPRDGALLWDLEHGLEGVVGTMPIALDDQRLLIYGHDEMVAYAVREQPDGVAVEELWRSKALGNSWALPVVHDGHLYGFRGRFLACVDAATGDTKWRSRPPGGRGLMVVDDQLAVVDFEGHLVLAAASPEGYRESARVAALAEGSYTVPSFAGDRFFVRNLSQLAAIRVTAATSGARAAAGPPAIEGALGALTARVAGTAEAREQIAAYLAAQPARPLAEPGGLVQFVYQGQAEDVAVAGVGLSTHDNELALQRIAGTDVWVRSVRLAETAERHYRFNVDYGTLIADPGNPLTVDTGRATVSALRMPGWQAAAHLAEPTGARGRLETVAVPEGGREVTVYLPAGYDTGSDAYPLLIVNRGERALAEGQFDRALDNLLGDRVRPLVAAFVPPSSRQELLNEPDGYLRFLTEALLPALETRYRLHGGARGRAVIGARDGGYAALYAALAAPGTFGSAAAQSMAARSQALEALSARVPPAAGAPLTVYLEWTAFERAHAGEAHQALLSALGAAGHRATGGEVEGTPEPFSVQHRSDRGLVALLPAER